jgi:alpha-L-fucosidase
MFERDLPGENHSGLSFQEASKLPLETCETINGAWGYNITDRKFKSPKQIIHLLVGAAGRNANLLLNVGPMPTGEIQPEFTDSLAVAGRWLKGHGESIYGTRGGPLGPQVWGVTTQTDKYVYVHLLKRPNEETIYIPGVYKKAPVAMLGETQTLNGAVEKQGIHIDVKQLPPYRIDLVLKLEKAN